MDKETVQAITNFAFALKSHYPNSHSVRATIDKELVNFLGDNFADNKPVYAFEYRNKHGNHSICYYTDIESTVKSIYKQGGTIISICEI